ncbi:aminotransferase class III-fold pyridoxal phosphate-dependent enzyme, partial [Oleiphilus sp. HI0066]|uniref:aminotransferase class III-fold pyridoxal phosphate-dependent enzyme n=4 Tax=Oleiphilus TaxID=141450 RepID=UPI000A40E3F1
ELEEKKVIEQVPEKNARFVNALEEINAEFQVFKEIRSCGLLIGCEMNEKYQGKAKDIMAKAMEQGLMALIAGPNVLRLAPSLIIADKDIDEGMALLRTAVREFVNTEV